MFKKWFAWYPVKLEHNVYAQPDFEGWVWLKVVYKRRIYVHTGGPYAISGYNVYTDKL